MGRWIIYIYRREFPNLNTKTLNTCIKHCKHTDKRKLRRLDHQNRFSSIAKVVNLSRSDRNALRLFQEWAALTYLERANHVACTVPPRALRRRWGRVTRAGPVILRCSRYELTTRMRRAVPSGRRALRPPPYFIEITRLPY